MSSPKAIIHRDTEALAQAASEIILQHARRAIEQRGQYQLVLAGGTSPQRAYQILAQQPQASDWSRWHLYHGDERCLPPDHPERNSRMVEQHWLNQLPASAPQHNPIPAELGSEAAASAYQQTLERHTHGRPFDLVLLGMGEDGHTASLFPGQTHPNSDRTKHSTLAIHQAPKPPPERVSLSPERLTHSHALLILISGQGKHSAWQQWQQQAEHCELPLAQLCRQATTPPILLLDQAAADGHS